MTQQPVASTQLSENADKLYKVIMALGPGWHGRPAIAKKLKKSRLTGYDAAALDFLVMQGKIEAERHELDVSIHAPIRERWEYRIKE